MEMINDGFLGNVWLTNCIYNCFKFAYQIMCFCGSIKAFWVFLLFFLHFCAQKTFDSLFVRAFHVYAPGQFKCLMFLCFFSPPTNQNSCSAFRRNPIKSLIVKPVFQLAGWVAYLLALPKRPKTASCPHSKTKHCER